MPIKTILATAILSATALAASANEPELLLEPTEVTQEREMRAPFVLDLEFFEEGDATGLGIAKATQRLSHKFRSPPLLELPGAVLDELHKTNEIPINMRREHAQTQQLACAVSMQIHGVLSIHDAMATPYFSELEKVNLLNDAAYDSFVYVNTANRGYYTYGHLMMQLLDKAKPGLVTKENASKAITLAPEANTPQYTAFISYCARLARDVSRSVDVTDRLRGLEFASQALDEEIQSAIPVTPEDSVTEH